MAEVKVRQLTQANDSYIELREKEVFFSNDLLFLDDKVTLQKRDSVGELMTKNGKPVMIKVKTLVKSEIGRMPVVNYKAFIRLLFEKALEYVTTLHWIHNAVTKARKENKAVQLEVNGENIAFGANELAHLKNDLIFVFNNIKSYIRSTKRASRTTAVPESFESVFSAVYLLKDFNDIVEGFSVHLNDAARDADDFYQNDPIGQQLNDRYPNDRGIFNGWPELAKRFASNDCVISQGMAQKFSVMSIFYSMAYLQNAYDARAIETLSASQEDLKDLGKDGLISLKSQYTGGSFSTPDYLENVLSRKSYWVFEPSSKTNRAGKTTFTFSTVVNNGNSSYNEVMASASRSSGAGKAPYNKDRLEMKFVNRLISLLTIPKETYIQLYYTNPDTDEDMRIRESVNSIVSEGFMDTRLSRVDMLVNLGYQKEDAEMSITPSGSFVNSGSLANRKAILNGGFNSNMLGDTKVITMVLRQTGSYHEHSRLIADDAKNKINKAIASIARKTRKTDKEKK
jgi:hypothetical protein